MTTIYILKVFSNALLNLPHRAVGTYFRYDLNVNVGIVIRWTPRHNTRHVLH